MKKAILIFLVFGFVGCSGPLIYMGPEMECIGKDYQPEVIIGTFVDAEDFLIQARNHDDSMIYWYYVPESVYNSTDTGDEVDFPDSWLIDGNNYTL